MIISCVTQQSSFYPSPAEESGGHCPHRKEVEGEDDEDCRVPVPDALEDLDRPHDSREVQLAVGEVHVCWLVLTAYFLCKLKLANNQFSLDSHQSPVSLQVLQRNTFSEQRSFVCCELRGEELTSHVSVDKHCRGLELRDGDEAEVMYSLSHYALLAGACVVNWSLSTLSSLSPLTSHCPLTSQETLLLPTTPLPLHDPHNHNISTSPDSRTFQMSNMFNRFVTEASLQIRFSRKSVRLVGRNTELV